MILNLLFGSNSGARSSCVVGCVTGKVESGEDDGVCPSSRIYQSTHDEYIVYLQTINVFQSHYEEPSII
jgi:hypothetical protein